MRRIVSLPSIWFIVMVYLFLFINSGIAISVKKDNNIISFHKIVQRDELTEKKQSLMTEDINTEHNKYPNNINFVTTTNQMNQTKNNTDPNNKSTNGDDDASLEKQLIDDQLALKRMITILSLVGGLGGLAIVATIIIYARMRNRKAKQEKETTINRNSSSDHGNDDNYDYIENGHQRTEGTSTNNNNNNNNNSNSNSNNGNNNNSLNEGSSSTHSSSSNVQRGLFNEENGLTPQPSAPPTTSSPVTNTIISTAILPTITIDQNQNQQQQQLLYMHSQQSSTPMPSAPSAKELAIQRENATSNTILYQSASSSSHHQQHSFLHDDDFENNYYNQNQSINHSIITPDIPPPAYTASPIFDRPTIPLENTNIPLTSTTTTSTTSTTSLPLRTVTQTHSHN